MIIYKLTNTITGKSYIGQTTESLKKRWSVHCAKKSACRALRNSIQKYGPEVFSKEVIETAPDIDHLNFLEQYYIKQFDTMVPNGYNLKTGGGNEKSSPETIELIRLKNTGKKRSEAFKKHMSVVSKGKKKSTQHIANMPTKFKKGLIPWNKNLKTGINNGRARTVICSNGLIYPSMKLAAEALGLRASDIRSICCGRQKTTKGFSFKYYRTETSV